MAIPTVASKLAPWSTIFRDVLVSQPGTYFVTPDEITELQGLTTSFLNAQSAVANPEARSGILIQARDEAQTNYYEFARPLYTRIQANPEISNENKVAAGVHVKDSTPTPTPIPQYAPKLSIVRVDGNVVQLRVEDSQVGSKTKPFGVKGASIYTFVGETPPDANGGWTLFGQSTRADFDLEFPGTLAAGTKVWIFATWFNTRNLQGPPCQPISTLLLGQPVGNVPGGNMKIAA